MAEPLRIAHISDLHIPLGFPVGREWTLKAALSAASWHLKRRRTHRPEIAATLLEDMKHHAPDLIAMTGDLVNFGSQAEFRNGSNYLKQLSDTKPLLCVPGNHELLSERSAQHMRTNCPLFLSGVNFPAFPALYVYGRYAVIRVSTAVPTPIGFASGRLGPDQRERLARMLGAAREAGQIPVVLMHHPPTEITARRKRLTDGPETCAIIAEFGAAIVLHGHTHHRELSWIDGQEGRIPVVGIGALSTRSEGHRTPGAWQMVEIHADGPSVTLFERRISPQGEIIGMTPMRLD